MIKQIFSSQIFNNAICIRSSINKKSQIIVSHNSILNFIELNPIRCRQIETKMQIKKLFFIDNEIYFTTAENKVFVLNGGVKKNGVIDYNKNGHNNDDKKNEYNDDKKNEYNNDDKKIMYNDDDKKNEHNNDEYENNHYYYKDYNEIAMDDSFFKQLNIPVKQEIIDIKGISKNIILITREHLIINNRKIRIKENILKMVLTSNIYLLTDTSILVFNGDGVFIGRVPAENINIHFFGDKEMLLRSIEIGSMSRNIPKSKYKKIFKSKSKDIPNSKCKNIHHVYTKYHSKLSDIVRINSSYANNILVNDLLITKKDIKNVLKVGNRIYFIENDLFVTPENEVIGNISDAYAYDENILLITNDYQILIFNDQGGIKGSKIDFNISEDNKNINNEWDSAVQDCLSKNIVLRIFGDNKIIGKIINYNPNFLIFSTSYGIVKYNGSISPSMPLDSLFTGLVLSEKDFIFDLFKSLIVMGGSDQVFRIRDFTNRDFKIDLNGAGGVITSIKVNEKYVVGGDNEGFVTVWENVFIRRLINNQGKENNDLKKHNDLEKDNDLKKYNDLEEGNDLENDNDLEMDNDLETDNNDYKNDSIPQKHNFHPLLSKQIHKKTINAILIFKNSLITASRDKLVKIINIVDGTEKAVLKHKRGIFAISRIGNTLVSSCGDGLYVWDMKRCLLKSFFEERSCLGCEVRYGRDIGGYLRKYDDKHTNGKHINEKYNDEELFLISGSYEGTLRIRNINGKQIYATSIINLKAGVNDSTQTNDPIDSDMLSINCISIFDKKIYLGTDRLLLIDRKLREKKIKNSLFNYKEILESKGRDLIKLVDGFDNLFKKMLFCRKYFKDFLD